MSKNKPAAIAMAVSCAFTSISFSSCENKKTTEVVPEESIVQDTVTSVPRNTVTTIASETELAVTTTLSTSAKRTITTATTTAYVASTVATTSSEIVETPAETTSSLAEIVNVETTSPAIEVAQDTPAEPIVYDVAEPINSMNYIQMEKTYANRFQTYIIEFGDCLYSVADKFECSSEEIQEANPNITDWNFILPGDSINIPESGMIASYYENCYVVESGDYLFKIAEKLECDADDLIKANPNVNWDEIQPGQSIVNPTPFVVIENTQPEMEIVSDWSEPTTTQVVAEEVTTVETTVEIVVETIPAETAIVEPIIVETTVAVEVVTETESSTSTTSTSSEAPSTTETTETDIVEVDVAVESYVSDMTDTNEQTNDSTASDESIVFEYGALPEYVMDEVMRQLQMYPGMEMGVGIYTLDGTKSFTYNEYQEISGGCTVKAAYALYVLKYCEENGIDISTTMLTYEDGMKNLGSGDIQFNYSYGDQMSVEFLLQKLLWISDNTAYNILCSRFGLDEFQVFLNSIGGQNLYGVQYGVASVDQRHNEWMAINDYVNGDSQYAQTLRDFITNTPYCYLSDGMASWHEYMHKSGWSDESLTYTCAADAAIVDNSYLAIVITQDYSTGIAHTDVVRSMGYAIEQSHNNGDF